LDTEEALGYYEKAEEFQPSLPGLGVKLNSTRKKRDSRKAKLSQLKSDRDIGSKRAAGVGVAQGRLEFAKSLRRTFESVKVFGPANKYIRIYGSSFNEYEAEVIARPPQLFLNDFRKYGFEKVTMVGPDYSRTYYLK
jgi:hypothetical protein